MDKKTLQNSILEKAYQPSTWLDVMKDYFGAKKFHQKPQTVSLPNNDIAESAVELGSFYTADERLVGMYEVHLKPKAWLDKNRVGLRNLLRQVYKYDVDGALIVFVQGEKWRFSFVSEIRTEEGKKETEPKRYTYLFGKGESCRTAAERFDKLKGKPIYLADLFDAFSVDKLNKDFFKSYKEFFEKFSAHLASNGDYRKLILGSKKELEKGWQDDEAKPIRDFSKKLLGRIVFLHFLQKKGWMGVPASNEKWAGGDAKFLQNLFLNYADKEHFHSKALKTLFFETLNKKRNNHIAPSALGTDIKIPYLNGGLFDKDISYNYNIDFPADLFKNLLEFFESYNFTIDENDPYDSEVGIDPEMLGHIFENLLEENREKGAFYTPKEIVHYMCQESLIQYLRTHLPECTEDESPATKALENFIRNGIVGERNDKKNFVVQQAKRIERLLDKVKICDPAIGSGAFPMGILQEIFKAKTALDLTLDHAETKKQIIQNCIYGVDIENGAVEIARLRFWLALVVDEDTPQPLPNLDYKIMQGNSLLESFEGIDLSKVHTVSKTTTIYEPQKDIFGNIVNPQLKFTDVKVLQENNLQQLMQDFFNETDPEKKLKQRERINQTVHEHIDYNLELWQRSLERQIAEAPNANRQDLKAATKKKIEELHKQLEDLIEKRKKLHELQNAVNKPYFLWHLFFADVFEKGGFDIVIGNPPYIQIKWLKEKDELKNANFKTYSSSGDVYCLFYEIATELLKKNGCGIFITSNKWLRSEYGKGLRSFFIDNTNPKKIIDFGGNKIFESASVDTNIFLWQKSIFKGTLSGVKIAPKFNLNLSEYFQNNSKITHLNANDNWNIGSAFESLRKKLECFKDRIETWPINLYYGILTGANPAFLINEETKERLIKLDKKNAEIIKPILRGKDIKKYGFQFSKVYLINSHNGIPRKGIKPIDVPKDYPKLLTYFESFGDKFRNRGEQGTNWYNLRSCDYIDEFEKTKIIYADIVQSEGKFYLDKEGYYTNDTAFIISGINLHFITAILNSYLVSFAYREFYSGGGLGDKGLRYKKEFLQKIPLPILKWESELIKLVDKITDIKKSGYDTSNLENKIDALVFHLYGLTEQEMLQVLDTFKELSIKDRNQIQNEYWNIANNKFQLEI
jgi:adenine-specific DNA-methyltransferase